MSIDAVLMVLPRLQEPVIHRQINVHDQHVGHRWRSATLPESLRDGFAVGRPPGVEQEPQRLVDLALSFASRQQEDREVLLDRAAGPPLL
jgi:hypothetical protein